MDKELLFKPRLAQDTVELPGLGTFRVRALSRLEAMGLQALDVAAADAKMIALGVVDPPLTEAEARRWQESSPAGEIEPVTNRISALSGMTTNAPKSGHDRDGGDGAGVRALPRPEAVDDRGRAAGLAQQ